MWKTPRQRPRVPNIAHNLTWFTLLEREIFIYFPSMNASRSALKLPKFTTRATRKGNTYKLTTGISRSNHRVKCVQSTQTTSQLTLSPLPVEGRFPIRNHNSLQLIRRHKTSDRSVRLRIDVRPVYNSPTTGTPAPWAPRLSVLARYSFIHFVSSPKSASFKGILRTTHFTEEAGDK